MKNHSDQQVTSNYMGALAHLLGGRPNRDRQFIQHVKLIFSGAEPHAMNLLQFSNSVLLTGRPVIWLHHRADWGVVPQIGLVARAGGNVMLIEHCFLWSTPGGRTTQLVPDGFDMGAFAFDNELKLHHSPTPPARNLKAARTGIQRAHTKLFRLIEEQHERGDVFATPIHAKAA